jgi:hypothetical protein
MHFALVDQRHCRRFGFLQELQGLSVNRQRFFPQDSRLPNIVVGAAGDPESMYEDLCLSMQSRCDILIALCCHLLKLEGI